MRRSTHDCPGCQAAPPSRRDALRLASNGFGLMALSALMADKSYAGLAAPKLHFVPKVKNVVFCYMPGGVSHIDTFDPKPKLTEYDGKPFDGFYQVGAKKETNRKWVKSPWQFARHVPTDRHKVAVAMRRLGGPDLAVVVREFPIGAAP